MKLVSGELETLTPIDSSNSSVSGNSIAQRNSPFRPLAPILDPCPDPTYYDFIAEWYVSNVVAYQLNARTRRCSLVAGFYVTSTRATTRIRLTSNACTTSLDFSSASSALSVFAVSSSYIEFTVGSTVGGSYYDNVIQNVMITSSTAALEYSLPYNCVTFAEKAGTTVVSSVVPGYNLLIDATPTRTSFNYDFDTTTHTGSTTLALSGFENRFDRVWSSNVQLRGMRLSSVLPVAGATTISLAGSCLGVYTFGQLGVNERVTTKSFTIPTTQLFSFPAITLYVRPNSALLPVPLSCFQITYSIGTAYTMSAAALTTSLASMPQSVMNFHVIDATPYSSTDPTTSFKYTVTREFSILPRVATSSGGTFTISDPDGCLCPSTVYAFITPPVEPFTASMVCSPQTFSTTQIQFTCTGSMAIKVWSRFFLQCSNAFTESQMDSCFVDARAASTKILVPYVDLTSESLARFDTVQTTSKFSMFFGAIASQRTLENNYMVPASVMTTPTLVTITIYMHVTVLPSSSFDLVVGVSGDLEWAADTTAVAGSGTSCTATGNAKFSCSAMSSRVVSASANGVATIIVKNVREPRGLVDFVVNPLAAVVTATVSYADSNMLSIIQDATEVRLAYYVYSLNSRAVTNYFLDSVAMIILPLSRSAGLPFIDLISIGQSFVPGASLTATSSRGFPAVTASVIDEFTVRVESVADVHFGFYITVTGTDILNTTSDLSAENPSGFGPGFFRMLVGSHSFAATSNTQFGPYAEAYGPTRFFITTTSVVAKSIATARIRSFVFAFDPVMGGNGGAGVTLVLSSTACKVDFSEVTLQSGLLAIHSASLDTIRFNVPTGCTKESTCIAVLAGVTVTASAGALNWPLSLAKSCFTTSLHVSGVAVGAPAQAEHDVDLFVSGTDLPMYTLVSDAALLPATRMKYFPNTGYSARYSGAYVSDPIRIFGVSFAGRTNNVYTLTSSCSALQLLDATDATVDAIDFHMDFRVYDLTYVADFRVKIDLAVVISSVAFSCFMIRIKSLGTTITSIFSGESVPLVFLPAFSVGLVDTKLSSLSDENTALSKFALTYELNMLLPKALTESTNLIFMDIDSCFCPNSQDAQLKTSTADPYGQVQPNVALECTLEASGPAFSIRCSTSISAHGWFSVNFVCPTMFNAEDLHKCVPKFVTKSVTFQFGSETVSPPESFFNMGPEVIMAARYLARAFPTGFSLTTGETSAVTQTMEFVLYIVTIPQYDFTFNLASSSVSLPAPPKPVSNELSKYCDIVPSSNKTFCSVLPAKDAVNTFILEKIVGTVANSYNLFSSGALTASIVSAGPTIRVTTSKKQWFAMGADYVGDYFGYMVTGASPVALYKSIRFTPTVGIAVLHPDYVPATPYTITFAASCNNAIIGDSSVTIDVVGTAPNVGARSIAANSISITTGCDLGSFVEFKGTNGAYLVRSDYATYSATGLHATCFSAKSGSYNLGVSPTSKIGPFPSAGPLLPLFFAVPAGITVETHYSLNSTYNFRVLITPRYALTTSIKVVIEYDYTTCPLENLPVSFDSTAATISVSTLLGTSPYSGCTKLSTGSSSSVGVTCNGSYNPTLHGNILLTVNGLTVLRESSLYASRFDGACFSVSMERMTAGFPDEDTHSMTGSLVVPSLLSVHQSTIFDDASTPTSMVVLLGKVHFPASSTRELLLDFPATRFVPTNAASDLKVALTNATLATMSANGVTGSAISLSVQPLGGALCNVQTSFALDEGCAVAPLGTVPIAPYSRTNVLFDYTYVWDKRSAQDIKLAGVVPVRRLPQAVQRSSAGIVSSSLLVKPAGAGLAGIILELSYVVSASISIAQGKHLIELPNTLIYTAPVAISGTGFISFNCVANICTGSATAENTFNITTSVIVGCTAPYALMRAKISIFDPVKSAGDVSLSIGAYPAPEMRAIEGYEPFDRLTAYETMQSPYSYLGQLSGPMAAPLTVTVAGSDNSFTINSQVTLAYTRILIQPSTSLQVKLSPLSPYMQAGGTATLTSVAVVETDGTNCTVPISAGVASLGACASTTANTILTLRVGTTHTQLPVLPVWIDVLMNGEKFVRYTLTTPQMPQLLNIAPVTVPSIDSLAISIIAGRGFAPTSAMGDSLTLTFELASTDATLAGCANAAGFVKWLSTGAAGPACALPQCSFTAATDASPVERLICTVSMLTTTCLSTSTPSSALPTMVTLNSCVKYDSDRARSPALILTISEPGVKRVLWRGQTQLTNVASKLAVNVGTWTASGIGASKMYHGVIPASQCKQTLVMQRTDKMRVAHSKPMSSFMSPDAIIAVTLSDIALGSKLLQPVTGSDNTGYFELSLSYNSALVCNDLQGGEITLQLPARVSSGTVTVQLLSPNGVKAEFVGTVVSSSVLFDTTIPSLGYTPYRSVQDVCVPAFEIGFNYNYSAHLAPNIVQFDIGAACTFSPSVARNFPVISSPGVTTGQVAADPIVSATGPNFIYLIITPPASSVFEIVTIHGLYCASSKQVRMRLIDPVTNDVGDDVVYTTPASINEYQAVTFVRGAYELESGGLPVGTPVGLRAGQLPVSMHLLIAVTLPVPITRDSVISLTGGAVTQCSGGASVLTGRLTLLTGATATALANCGFSVTFSALTDLIEPYTTIHVFLRSATLPMRMDTNANASPGYFTLAYTDPRVMPLFSVQVLPLKSSYVALEVVSSTLAHDALFRAPTLKFSLRGQGVRPISSSGKLKTTLRIMFSTLTLAKKITTDNIKLYISYVGTAGLTIGTSICDSTLASEKLDPVLGLSHGLDLRFSTALTGSVGYKTSGNFTFMYELAYLNPMPELYGETATFGVTIELPTDTVPNVAKFTHVFPAAKPLLSHFTAKILPVRVSSADGVLLRVRFLGQAGTRNFDTQVDHHGSDGVANLGWRMRVKLNTLGYLVVVLPPELAYSSSTTAVATLTEFSDSTSASTLSSVCTPTVTSLICSQANDKAIRGSTCVDTLGSTCLLYEITPKSVASQFSDITFSGLVRQMNAVKLASARGQYATLAFADHELSFVDAPLHLGLPGLERNWEFGTDFEVKSTQNLVTKTADYPSVCSVVDPVALVVYTLMSHGGLRADSMQHNPENGLENTPWGTWSSSASSSATLLPMEHGSVIQCSIVVAVDGRHIAVNINNNRVMLIERGGTNELTITGSVMLPADEAPRTEYPGASGRSYTAKLFFSQWQTADAASLYMVTLSSSLRRILVAADGSLSLGSVTELVLTSRPTAIAGDSTSEAFALCGPSLGNSKIVSCDIVSIATGVPIFIVAKTVTATKPMLPTAVTFCPPSNINTFSPLTDQCLFVAATESTSTTTTPNAAARQYIFRVSLDAGALAAKPVLAAVLESHPIAAIGVTGYQSQLIMFTVSQSRTLYFSVLTRVNRAGQYGRQSADITHESMTHIGDVSDIQVHLDATRTTFFHVAPDCNLMHVSALPRLYDVVKDENQARGKLDWELSSSSQIIVTTDGNSVEVGLLANMTHIAFYPRIGDQDIRTSAVMNPLTTHVDASLGGNTAVCVIFFPSQPSKTSVSAVLELQNQLPLSIVLHRAALQSRESATTTKLAIAFSANLGNVNTKKFTVSFTGPFTLPALFSGNGTSRDSVSFSFSCAVAGAKCTFITTQPQFKRHDEYQFEIMIKLKSFSLTFGSSSSVLLAVLLENPTCGTDYSCQAFLEQVVNDVLPLLAPAGPPRACLVMPTANTSSVKVYDTVHWLHSPRLSCAVFDDYTHCFNVLESSLFMGNALFDYNGITARVSRSLHVTPNSTVRAISTSHDAALMFISNSTSNFVSSNLYMIDETDAMNGIPPFSSLVSSIVGDAITSGYIHITSTLLNSANLVLLFGKSLNLLGIRRVEIDGLRVQTVTGLDSLDGTLLGAFSALDLFNEGQATVCVTTPETGRPLAGVVDFAEYASRHIFPADSAVIILFAFRSGYVRLCAGPGVDTDVAAATDPHTILQCQNAVLVSPNSEITAVVALSGNAVAYVSTSGGDMYILTPDATKPDLLGIIKSPVSAGCHVRSLALHPAQTLLTFACSDARVASFAVDPVTGQLSELLFVSGPGRKWEDYQVTGIESIAYTRFGSHFLLLSADKGKTTVLASSVATIAPVVVAAVMPATAGVKGSVTFTLQPPPLITASVILFAVTFPQSTKFTSTSAVTTVSGTSSCAGTVLIDDNVLYSRILPTCIDTTNTLKVTITNIMSGAASLVGETALYAEFRFSTEALSVPVSLSTWNAAVPIFYSPRMPIARRSLGASLVDCYTGALLPEVLSALVDYTICVKLQTLTLPTVSINLSIGRLVDGDGPGSDPDDYFAPCLFTSVRSRHLTDFVINAGATLSSPLTIRCTEASASAGDSRHTIRALFTDVNTKWQSGVFSVAPAVSIALRVAQGSTVSIDPPTVPASVAVMVQSMWNVPPIEEITIKLAVNSSDCVFASGNIIAVSPAQFNNHVSIVDLTTVTCATPNAAGVEFSATVLFPPTTAALLSTSSAVRPVIGTLFLQGSSSSEPFVFSTDNEYDVTLIASPAPTNGITVDLTLTRYGIPLPQMACHLVPNNVSALAVMLLQPQPLKVKCSRPVAHEEFVELQISSPDAAENGYKVLNGNIITAYIGATQSVWPADGLVAALTTARLSLLPARPLPHKTIVLYEVLTDNVRCAISMNKTLLDHMTESQTAFNNGDFENGVDLNKYVGDTPIGATAIDVYALCDTSGVEYSPVRVRYTVLKGTPLRDLAIGTGVFELIVRNRMRVRSLVQPLGDTPIDNVGFKTLPAALRVEYAFSKAVNTLIHVSSDTIDVCVFSSYDGQELGSEFDLTIANLTGVDNVMFACSEPRANITLTVTHLSNDNVTTIKDHVGPFHIYGELTVTLQADNSAAVATIAGHGAVNVVSVPLAVPHTLIIATTPVTAGADLIAEISHQSGKCVFASTSSCVTDAAGQCKLMLSCGAPAQTPPSVIVRGYGIYAFVTAVSAPLQTKGNLIVEQLDIVNPGRPYYLAGEYYRVRVAFDPQPEEPVIVRVSQTTTMASCMFTLTGDTSRMQRTIQWQHTALFDELLFGLVCSRPHAVGSLIALETVAYMPYNLGPTITYGRMSLDFRLPTGIVGPQSIDVTDMAARLQLSNAPVGQPLPLRKPHYLRAPLTNLTTFRIRLQPAVVVLTLINLKMTSALSGCQFSIFKSGGGSEQLGANAQVSAVLGETEHDVLVSCELPKSSSFSIIAEISSGSPYVPLVSLPMQPRGTVLMTTSGVPAASAFTGEIFSLRRWVMRFMLSPLPAETVTLTFVVASGPNKDLVPSCRFYGETDADITDAGRENTLVFTPTMVMVGVAVICDVSLKDSAYIQVHNNEELYDEFSSAPFRVRGAVWTEDAALPQFSQFPGTASTYVDVAVGVSHLIRMRVVPTWSQAVNMTLSVNVTSCGVGLYDAESFDGSIAPPDHGGTVVIIDADAIPVFSDINVTIPANADIVLAVLRCSTVAHYITVTLGPSDPGKVFASTHITGSFSASNRFEVRNLPATLHMREPVLMELGVLPFGAIAGLGQSTVVRVSTNSAFANCSVARVAGSSTAVPAETLWSSVNETASFLLTISAASAGSLWVRCWQHTVNGAGVAVEGAVKPQFKFGHSSGVAFLTRVSAEIDVVFIDCGAMPKLTYGNTVYEDNGFGSMAYLARATASCETGYDLATSAGVVVTCATLPCRWTATCQAAGWSESAPHCAIHNCGAAPPTDNKTASGPTYAVAGNNGGATTYGAVVTYGCAEGYESSGTTASIRCTPTGWSQPTAPTCTPVTCPALAIGANTLQPAYGTTPNGMRRYLSTATYECLPGHTLDSGSLTLMCRADRTWSGAPPVCRTNMCLHISHDSSTQKPISFSFNGKVTTADKATGFFFVDTVAEYSCADGYSWVDPNGSRTRTCVYDEGWLPVLAPRCLPVPCPSLESLFYGSIKQEPAELMNLYGVTATYMCAYGATVTPPGNIISCMADGKWSASPRTCQPYQCTSPTAFASGQVQEITTGVNGPFSNNSVIEYRCNTGFNLVYPGVAIDTKYYLPITTGAGVAIEVGRRECTPNGWLPSTLPQCVIHECSTLVGTSNVASITYFNNNGATLPQYGTVATYTCSPGYETRDSNDNVVANSRLCGSRDQGWLPFDPPRCMPVDCGVITKIDIENALPIEYTWDSVTVKGPTRLSATVDYNCKPGFAFSDGNSTFTRTCSATRQWVPVEPTCTDINECDANLFGGKYFVNCTALHGVQSQCVNTFGSNICVPLVTTAPFQPYAVSGSVLFNAADNVFTPGNTAGGQRIMFAVRAGAGLVEPFFSRVRYLNPDKALYDDPAMLQYECKNVEVVAANAAASVAAGYSYFAVSCELSPGQGEGLFVSLQYCVSVYGRGEPDCSRWNWDWQGTRGTIDMEQIPINERLRITYPMPAFVPRSLQSVTMGGLTQMTDEYVSQTSLGEDILMAVNNFYLDRPELITLRYGEALTENDFPYICDFNHLMAVQYSGYMLVTACRTQDRVNLIDLRFRLCIAGRCTVSTDRYSYPQIPEITSVYGCAVDDILNGRTQNCPTDGADVRLTVAGTGFLEPLSLIISGRQCLHLERANNTYFTCSLPVGAGEALSVTVKAGSQRTESRNRLSYASPTIIGIRGCEPVSDVYIRECNRLGGNIIELTGHNFGITASTIMVGGQNCVNVTHDPSRPHERVTCTTPSGSASERTVTLLQRYGTMSLENILLSYVQCPPGRYGVDIVCLPCETGYFNDMWSQTSCRQCTPGLYSNETGATSCFVCPAGHHSELGAHSCGVCPRGTFSGERSGSCMQCPSGTFAQYEGSSVCEACPLGAESNEDYTFCRCTVGTYMDADGECVKCMLGGDCTAPGTTIYNIHSLPGYAPAVVRHKRDSVVRMRLYVPVNSATEQARKSARATVTKLLYDNSSLPFERIVLAGLEFLTEGELKASKLAAGEDGKNGTSNQSDKKDSVLIFSANAVLITTDNATYPLVFGATLRADAALVAVVDVNVYPNASGAYAFENSSEALYQRVVEQLIANSALVFSRGSEAVLTGDGITRDPDFERFATPSFELCINGACRGNDVCLEGHTGNLCAVCLSGYGKSSSFECARCNTPALRTFLLVLAILGAIAVCTVLVWKQIVDGKQSMNELPAPAVPLLLKVATSGLQVMSIAARYDLQWPGFLASVFDTADTAGGVGTAFLSLDCFLAEDPAVQPFWVTTISMMVLPLAGVVLPAMVFVPMYFSERRHYRKDLLKRAAEERALSAEVIMELKNSEKRDRGEHLQQRREKMANENTLVWDLIDEKEGLTVDNLVSIHPFTEQTVSRNSNNQINVTSSVVRRGDSSSNSISVDDNSGNGRQSVATAPKKRRVIRKPRMANSVGDITKSPLPPPVRPPVHGRVDSNVSEEDDDKGLCEFGVTPVVMDSRIAPSSPKLLANASPMLRSNSSLSFGSVVGSTGLGSEPASPTFGAVAVPGGRVSRALPALGPSS